MHTGTGWITAASGGLGNEARSADWRRLRPGRCGRGLTASSIAVDDQGRQRAITWWKIVVVREGMYRMSNTGDGGISWCSPSAPSPARASGVEGVRYIVGKPVRAKGLFARFGSGSCKATEGSLCPRCWHQVQPSAVITMGPRRQFICITDSCLLRGGRHSTLSLGAQVAGPASSPPARVANPQTFRMDDRPGGGAESQASAVHGGAVKAAVGNEVSVGHPTEQLGGNPPAGVNCDRTSAWPSFMVFSAHQLRDQHDLRPCGMTTIVIARA